MNEALTNEKKHNFTSKSGFFSYVFTTKTWAVPHPKKPPKIFSRSLVVSVLPVPAGPAGAPHGSYQGIIVVIHIHTYIHIYIYYTYTVYTSYTALHCILDIYIYYTYYIKLICCMCVYYIYIWVAELCWTNLSFGSK